MSARNHRRTGLHGLTYLDENSRTTTSLLLSALGSGKGVDHPVQDEPGLLIIIPSSQHTHVRDRGSPVIRPKISDQLVVHTHMLGTNQYLPDRLFLPGSCVEIQFEGGKEGKIPPGLANGKSPVPNLGRGESA